MIQSARPAGRRRSSGGPLVDQRNSRGWLATLLTLGFLLLFACASGDPQVSTAFDPWTHFPAEATYVWDEAASREPDDTWVRELNFGARLRKITTETLAARGYREVASGPAPYRVSYQLNVYSGISGGPSNAVASLSILLTDASSGGRLWVGFARTTPQLELPEETRDERMRALVQRMFEGFPPLQTGD